MLGSCTVPWLHLAPSAEKKVGHYVTPQLPEASEVKITCGFLRAAPAIEHAPFQIGRKQPHHLKSERNAAFRRTLWCSSFTLFDRSIMHLSNAVGRSGASAALHSQLLIQQIYLGETPTGNHCHQSYPLSLDRVIKRSIIKLGRGITKTRKLTHDAYIELRDTPYTMTSLPALQREVLAAMQA